MSRPSIALCMIMKNEAHNLSRILQSVKGCFDQIHITDTGSTDSTVDFLEKINEQIKAGSRVWEGLPEIKIHHFEWVNDFAQARNYSFSHATTDYVMWMDGDDELSDPKAFIHWRDTVLHSAHYWVALYNYAFNDKGVADCKFIRERVIKNNFGFKWEYFVHEGLMMSIPGKKYWPQRVSSWWINHRRTEDDKKQDHMRNVKLFEAQSYETMPPRMLFYYGKELTENGFPDKGCKPLLDSIKSGKLDMHDNLLAIQYAAHSAIQCKAYAQAVDLALNGLKLTVGRAEFWCLLGDAYLGANAVESAVFAYESALRCQPNDMGGVVVISDHAYAEYPHRQLAQIFITAGNLEKAMPHVDWMGSVSHPLFPEFQKSLNGLAELGLVREDLPKTDDVIITCPPRMAVTDWDENTLEAKGHGGSETAAIEVAKWIKRKTNRRVKIFHQRAKRDIMASGVEYLPIQDVQGYLQNIEPAAHIAWRHPVRLTKAKTFVWCHDLQCPGAEKGGFDKIVALSGFHKEYLKETNGLKEEQIALGFNGINPDDFLEEAEKDPLKIVFSSSPDRGLTQTIDIVKKAREVSGLDLKLHCFYGFENMRKAGQQEWADQIEAKIRDNPFVIAHGLVTKKVLMKHFKEAAVWLYPNDFIESFCITAIEALCAGTWPIVRDMGALKYTLKEALEKNMCDFLTVEVLDEASIGLWANTLIEAIIDKKWKRVQVNPQDYSWEKVADFFCKEMSL